MSSIARRTFLRSGGIAVTSIAVAGCTRIIDGGGDGSSGKQIVAGTAPGFPPFEMEKGGDLVGFDIDLLDAVVKQTDYNLKTWKTFEFKSLIPALTSQKIDVIAAGLTINDTRKKKISFTRPYYNADQSILVRKNSDFAPNSLKDLSGHPIGAQSGTTGEGLIKEQTKKGTFKKSNYKSYDSYVLAVQDLENGNIDAVVVDKPVAQTFIEERSVKVAKTITTGERYGFGIRKEDSDRQKALNEGLTSVRESGKYDELKRKWFATKQN